MSLAYSHEVRATLDGAPHRLGRFASVEGAVSFASVLATSRAWRDVRVAMLSPLDSAIAAEVDRALGEA